MKKSFTLLGALALVLAISSGAFATNALLTGAQIQDRSLTGVDIKKQSLDANLLTSSAKTSLRGPRGSEGAEGLAGAAGPVGLAGASVVGARGTNGANGLAGTDGTNGTDGANGLAGTDGTNGANGLPGTNGTNGANGLPGTNGTAGAAGAAGANGIVTPLSATTGTTVLPPAGPPIVIVSLAVPTAGKYVVLAKAQLFQSGAGDAIECVLKANGTPIDQVAMKTLPALAEVPVSLQAVTTVTSNSQLSVECDMRTADGTASFNSLIAIPTS
jgi:hypothetical protein